MQFQIKLQGLPKFRFWTHGFKLHGFLFFRAGSVGDGRFSSAVHYNRASKMDTLLLQLP